MITEIRYGSREEWLAIRAKYIGGSDAGAVIGLNPYKSAYALWAEKTGKIAPFEGNLTTEVGSYLEEFVAGLFTRETGLKVRRKNVTLVNEKYPFACANLDRVIVGEKAFLEIKTTNSFPLMRKLRESSEFPDAYYAQCVHYMAVTGLKKCYLAVLVNCRELLVYELDYDKDEAEALMRSEQHFWRDHVLTNSPPPIDGSESTAQTIDALTGDSTGAEADLTPLEDDLHKYASLVTLAADVDRQIGEIKNRVKAYMGDAGTGACAGYSVTYKTQERRQLDAKRLREDYPEIRAGRYDKVSSSRPMTIRIKASA